MKPQRLHFAVLAQGSWTLVTNLGAKLQVISLIVSAGIASGSMGVAQVSTSAGLAVVAAAGVDFGFSTEWSRRLAASGDAAAAAPLAGVLARASIASLLGGLLSFVLAQTTAISVPPVASAWVGVWTGATMLTSSATLLGQGMGRFRETSLVSGVLRVLGAAAVISVGARLSAVAVIAIASLTEVLIASALFRSIRASTPPAASCRMSVERKPGPSYAWLGVGSLVNTIINKSDILIVSVVAGVVGTATYSVASQVQNAVTTVALAPAAATLAYVARSRLETLDTTEAVVRATGKAVSALAAAIAIVGLAVSIMLVQTEWQFTLTDELERSLAPLAICLLAAPISVHAATHLSACVGLAGHRDVAAVWLVTAILTLPAFLILAWHWAAVGAALGALGRDLVLLALSKRLWRTVLERWADSEAEPRGGGRIGRMTQCP